MKRGRYDPDRFRAFLADLVRQTDETCEAASLAAGLDRGAVARFMQGARPNRIACVQLAEHFGVNPNEMLQAAGYEPLSFFAEGPVDEAWMNREIEGIIERIRQIKNPFRRRRVIRYMLDLLAIVDRED